MAHRLNNWITIEENRPTTIEAFIRDLLKVSLISILSYILLALGFAL